MSKTFAGAFRSVVIANGAVEDRVFLDFAPVDVERVPYVTYNDNVAFSPIQRGDARTMNYVRDMQLNLWEKDNEEDPDLLKQLILIDGEPLEIEGLAFRPRIKLLSCTRLADNQDDQIVHHEMTIAIVNPRGVF